MSIAHLENRIAAAQTLGAKDEFRVYLIMYAKRIGAEGLRVGRRALTTRRRVSGVQLRPTVRPYASMSIRSAFGCRDSPGIVRMSPEIA